SRDHKLTVDTADGFPLGDHQPGQVCGKMVAGRCGVKHITKDGQRFLYQGRKVHDGWHSGSLRPALMVLRVQRGVLHYTPSNLLCKTSVPSFSLHCYTNPNTQRNYVKYYGIGIKRAIVKSCVQRAHAASCSTRRPSLKRMPCMTSGR